MTKAELDRIKKAYSSGLKVQIWFNGYWEDFDIRDYSMYSEPFSERRQYRIVGSDYADIAENQISELEKENKELKTVKIPQLERKIASIRGAHSVDCKKLNARTEQVERLKKENAELKNRNAELAGQKASLERWFGEAKEIIKLLLWDLRNRSYEPIKDVERAEQFLNSEVSE